MPGGGHVDEEGAVAISVPPAVMPTPHLGEVPALDEVSGDISCCFAMHHGGDVMPGHPRGGVSVDEVCRIGKHVWTSKERNVEKCSIPLLKLKFLGHGTKGCADEFRSTMQLPAV